MERLNSASNRFPGTDDVETGAMPSISMGTSPTIRPEQMNTSIQVRRAEGAVANYAAFNVALDALGPELSYPKGWAPELLNRMAHRRPQSGCRCRRPATVSARLCGRHLAQASGQPRGVRLTSAEGAGPVTAAWWRGPAARTRRALGARAGEHASGVFCGAKSFYHEPGATRSELFAPGHRRDQLPGTPPMPAR